MSKIDVSQWKEFKLTNLFEPHHGKRLTKRDRVSGDVPFLTAGFDNQGVKGYLAGNFEIWHNPISIDMFGNCFYHEYDCTGDDNVYALVNNEMTSNSKLFIAGVLNKQLSIQFSYKDQFRQHDLDVLSIKLPVTSSGEPDWHYMDEYIAKRAVLAHKYVSELKSTKNQRKSLKISGWQEYKISQLFNIRSSEYIRENGKAISNRQLLNGGSNPVVVNSSANNGIGGTTSYEPTEHGNVITYSDTVDGNTIFYQAKPFVGYSHVKVMEPKEKRDPVEMMFLTAVIGRRLSDGNYDYTNKMTTNRVLNTTIKLPALSDGTPDWATMRKRVADFQCSVYRTMILLLDLV